MNISINTKLYAVIGDPIVQSLSPVLHNGLFENYQIDAIYLPFGVKKDELGQLMNGFRTMKFGGFNVTKPHKISIMEYLDEIDPLAQKIGAVNTVVNDHGKMIGYNTDGYGFIKSIEKNIKYKETLNVLIFGCGGAVKSVAMALANWGIKEVIIVNRTYEKAQKLCDQINECWPQKARAIVMQDDQIKEAIQMVQIVVNGTSLGMADNYKKTPILKERLTKDLLVYDMIYNPSKTQLLQDAESNGAEIKNGLEMLLFQGLKAFELWTDIIPDSKFGKKILVESLEK